MRAVRHILFVLAAAFYLLPSLAAYGQAYTSIVIFGDSLSDTGNDATLTAAKYGLSGQVPGPASDYTSGRFTDGTDTLPAAVNYKGVWVEQLAAMFTAKPPVLNSLAGGTNYAYGFATTDVGTSILAYGPGSAFSVVVNNMGQQVTDYLATSPVITNKTLFIVWGGANDILNATSPTAITNAVSQEAAIVQRLVAAGATDILVPNLPPLGLVPRVSGTPALAIAATAAAQGFNQALAASLAAIPAANPGKTLHIFQLDIYTLFNTIVGPPVVKGFTNVTASSQAQPVNPDTYLFWDDLHPTTFGHSQIAAAADILLGAPDTTTTVVTSSSLNANLKSSVTFTASVTAATGTPIGTVTFMDGTTVLATAMLSGSTTTATATYTTTALTAGTHPITAVYTGVNGFVSSTSAAISEIVTAPALTSSLSPTSITILRGQSGNSTVTVSPVGGYSGTVTFACGTLPAHFSCSFTATSLTLSGNNAQQTTLLTIGTSNLTSLTLPARPGAAKLPEVFVAFGIFPLVGFAGLAAFRRRKLLRGNVGLMVLMLMLSAGAALGLSGCSDSSPAPNNNAAPGTYTVPVNVTSSGSTTTLNLTVVVQ
jgi:phospholipase/lecithinase/hemolysin